MLADIERQMQLASQNRGELPDEPEGLTTLRPVSLAYVAKADSGSRLHYCGEAVIELTKRMILLFNNQENASLLSAGLPGTIFAVPVAYVSLASTTELSLADFSLARVSVARYADWHPSPKGDAFVRR